MNVPTITLSMTRLKESGATEDEIKSMIDRIGMSVESTDKESITI